MSESQRAGKGPSQQLDSGTAKADFPNNTATIPVPLTSLVGRAQEIEQVMDLLRSGESRLITITGPGGVGKTRLALQVAAQARGLFGHGAYFIPLASIAEPTMLLPTIAQTLGVVEKGRETTLQALCSALGSRHLLLILDNFEQIIPAGPQVLDLLQCAPRLQVLVTSRAALRVYGEQEYPVAPFAIPQSIVEASLERLTQYDAVRLFIARACAVKPGFSVTNSSAPAVAEICQRLDGLPLAIELAAARIKLLSPHALLKRLDRSLPLLTGGATTLPYRHQTLRDAIAWSYNLLAEEEQRVFRCLSIFSGGCTQEAAQAVCDGHTGPDEQNTSVFDTLTALVDKSLVRHVEQDDGEPRFSFLETIREFAWELLVAQGEDGEVGARHNAFFVALAESAFPNLKGANQVVWLDKIAHDYDNLRAVFARAQGEGDPMPGLLLTHALWPFWYIRGYQYEARAFAKAALEMGGDTHALLRAQAAGVLGNLSGMQGDYEAARIYHEQALQLYRELGITDRIAAMLGNLANTARQQGDFAVAETLLQQVVTLIRSTESTNLPIALTNLASVIATRGEHEEAMRLCDEALHIYESRGDTHGKAITLNRMGEIAASQGKPSEARAYQEQSLDLTRHLGDKSGVTRALLELGKLATANGDVAKARSLLSESLALRYEGGNTRTIADNLSALASVEGESSDPTRLVTLLVQAQTIYDETDVRLSPQSEREQAKWLGFARAKLTPEEYQIARNRGLAISLKDAVALALQPPEGAPDIAPVVIAPVPKSDLTTRELEVLRLISVGLTNPGIAAHLQISINTVQTHLRSIFSKINVTTRGAAVRYAFEHNLG